jgi:hypothetical protein
MKSDIENVTSCQPSRLVRPHNMAVAHGMLNDQRNDLHYDNKDKKDSGFIANRSSRLLACLCGRQIQAARDYSVLRMSAFPVGLDFDAR